MQFAAHRALQRRIDQLVLFHPGHAGKLRADNLGLPVIIITGEIGECDLGVRKGVGQVAELGVAGHGHGSVSSIQLGTWMQVPMGSRWREEQLQR